jgi:SpoIIAA-like
MPITYSQDGGLLRVRAAGVITAAELHAMVTEMEQRFVSANKWPDNLLDLTGIDLSGLGFADMMSLAKRRESVKPPHAIRTAIVADSPTVVGFARMFQTLNNNPDITVQVFQSAADAEDWLAR